MVAQIVIINFRVAFVEYFSQKVNRRGNYLLFSSYRPIHKQDQNGINGLQYIKIRPVLVRIMKRR